MNTRNENPRSLPGLRRMAVNAEVRAIEDEKLEVTHLITTPTADRAGDIIDPEGAVLEQFRRNPVVLVNHDYSVESIIGTAEDLQVTPDGIRAKTKFHRQTWLAIDVWKLVKAGIAKAWSIGFRPVRSHSINRGKDDGCSTCVERFRELSEGKNPGDRVPGSFGQHFVSWELLEYSLVAIPMNSDAVNACVQRGLVQSENAETLFRCELPVLGRAKLSRATIDYAAASIRAIRQEAGLVR